MQGYDALEPYMGGSGGVMNLLTETIEKLVDNKKSPSDVLWVGTTVSCFDWDWFTQVADIEYDAGFGGQEIATNLIVVGKDWWLERHEQDGSEWWEYKSMPAQPKKKTKPPRLKSSRGYWNTLEEINSPAREDDDENR